MATGCLIIHGLGGSSREVGTLPESLSAAGYIVLCPMLKGHTGNRKDFKGVTYNDWIRSAEDALLQLQNQCSEVVIIGFSMGGLVGMQLCMKHKVNLLITINTPVYFWDLKLMFQNTVSDLRTKSYNNIRRYLRSSGKLPAPALITFLQLLYRTRKEVVQVTTPIHIIQAMDDDVVQSRSADFLYNSVRSKQKSGKSYPTGGHVILLSSRAEEVINDICILLNKPFVTSQTIYS